MEQCFRIALWVFFLVGYYLEARPVCSEQGDMDFCYLQRDVKCGNVTFTYPENVDEDNCRNEVLQSFKGQLEHAASKCQDVDTRIVDTLEALDDQFPSTPTNSTECTLATKESRFKGFVKDLESFVQLLNAKAAE